MVSTLWDRHTGKPMRLSLKNQHTRVHVFGNEELRTLSKRQS